MKYHIIFLLVLFTIAASTPGFASGSDADLSVTVITDTNIVIAGMEMTIKIIHGDESQLPPVMIFHGWAVNWKSLQNFMRRLSTLTHTSIWAPEIPGLEKGDPYMGMCLSDYVDLFIGLLDWFYGRYGRLPYLVMDSSSGLLGGHLAARRPDLISQGMKLINPAGAHRWVNQIFMLKVKLGLMGFSSLFSRDARNFHKYANMMGIKHTMKCAFKRFNIFKDSYLIPFEDIPDSARISVIVGRSDEAFTRGRSRLEKYFIVQVIPGGHFLIRDRGARIAQMIDKDLRTKSDYIKISQQIR